MNLEDNSGLFVTDQSITRPVCMNTGQHEMSLWYQRPQCLSGQNITAMIFDLSATEITYEGNRDLRLSSAIEHGLP
jgi:hypothetical protein